MNRYHLHFVLALTLFVTSAGSALGQGELIGRRGGSTPTTTVPTLPPTLNLPDNVESSLLKGLNASGTAMRPGMGWLVSDLTHQGIHGRELADIIHQLKPYKQRGVLTFPQQQAGAGQGGLTFLQQHGGGQGGLTFPPKQHGGGHAMPGGFGGGGFGKGHGKKK